MEALAMATIFVVSVVLAVMVARAMLESVLSSMARASSPHPAKV